MKRSGAEDHPLGAYDQENDYLDSIGLWKVLVVVVVVVVVEFIVSKE